MNCFECHKEIKMNQQYISLGIMGFEYQLMGKNWLHLSCLKNLSGPDWFMKLIETTTYTSPLKDFNESPMKCVK